jgi:predicted ATPase
MNLKRISIENFKSIKEPAKIDLKPITLLFGTNSVGKSSILQALQFIKRVLLHNDITIYENDDEQEKKNGQFSDIIHCHNLSNSLKFQFDFEFPPYKHREVDIFNEPILDEDKPFVDFFLNDGTKRKYFKFHSAFKLLKDLSSLSVILEICWDDRINKTMLKSYQIFLNNQKFATIEKGYEKFDESLIANLILFRHDIIPTEVISVLLKDRKNAIDYDGYLERQQLQVHENELHNQEPYQYQPEDINLQDDWSDRYDDMESDDFFGDVGSSYENESVHTYDDNKEDKRKENEKQNRIHEVDEYCEKAKREIDLEEYVFKTNIAFLGELPESDRPFHIFKHYRVYSDDIKSGGLEFYDFFDDLISQIITVPINLLKSYFKSFDHIGPLRKKVQRNYSDTMNSTQSLSWYSGLASYNSILQADESLIESINYWLTHKKKLNTNYKVIRNKYKILDIASTIMSSILKGHELSETEYKKTIIDKLSSVRERIEFNLFENEKKLNLSTQDVGSGISQVLPILTWALSKSEGILSIEQPELHIHPAMQISLGDLFIESALSKSKRNYFIVETHSEHLLLRILRRVSETNNNELPQEIQQIKPDDIAVYYIHSEKGNAIINKLEVDESGDFKDEWPEGFFEERDEELFLK